MAAENFILDSVCSSEKVLYFDDNDDNDGHNANATRMFPRGGEAFL
jgi:hypothetical protein